MFFVARNDSAPPSTTIVGTEGLWLLQVDTTLSADHLGAIEINDDGITLDCDGHSLRPRGPQDPVGILTRGLSRITIANCLIEGFELGMKLVDTYDSTVIGNTTNNNYAGISLRNSSSNTLSGNRADGNVTGGFLLQISHDNLITGNEATKNAVGFLLEGANWNRLIDNVATGNILRAFEDHGIDNVFEGNTPAEWNWFNQPAGSVP
jgi:parallel beta-helix repeat protein